MIGYKGSDKHSRKRQRFYRDRSTNRRFWKRYARRCERRGMSNGRDTGHRDGWLHYLINNP